MGKLIFTGPQIDEAIKKVKDGEKDVSAVTAGADDVRLGKIIVDKNKVEVAGTIGDASVTPSFSVSSRFISDDVTSYPVSITPKLKVNSRGIIKNGGNGPSDHVYIQTEEKEVTPSGEAQDITPTSGKMMSKVTVAPIPDAPEYPITGFPVPYFYYYCTKSTTSSSFTTCKITRGTVANNIYLKSGVSSDKGKVYIVPLSTSSTSYLSGTNFPLDSYTHREKDGTIILNLGDSFVSESSNFAPSATLEVTMAGRIKLTFNEDYECMTVGTSSSPITRLLLILYKGSKHYGVYLDADCWNYGTQYIGTKTSGTIRRYSDRGCPTQYSLVDGVSSYNLTAAGKLVSNYGPIFFEWNYVNDSTSYHLPCMTHGGGTKYYIPIETKKLDEPVVSITSAGVASWPAVTGATTYAISITGTASYSLTTSATSYNLRNKITTGGTYYVKVQARASGIASDYCDPITYVLSLAAPVISISGSVVSWNAVTDATSYYIYRDGVQWTTTSATSIDLSQFTLSGGTYSITAKSYKSGWSLSPESNSVSYIRVGAPELVLSSEGILSWAEPYAANYYVISIDGTEIQRSTARIIDLTDYVDISETHEVTVVAYNLAGDHSDTSKVHTGSHSVHNMSCSDFSFGENYFDLTMFADFSTDLTGYYASNFTQEMLDAITEITTTTRTWQQGFGLQDLKAAPVEPVRPGGSITFDDYPTVTLDASTGYFRLILSGEVSGVSQTYYLDSISILSDTVS